MKTSLWPEKLFVGAWALWTEWLFFSMRLFSSNQSCRVKNWVTAISNFDQKCYFDVPSCWNIGIFFLLLKFIFTFCVNTAKSQTLKQLWKIQSNNLLIFFSTTNPVHRKIYSWFEFFFELYSLECAPYWIPQPSLNSNKN